MRSDISKSKPPPQASDGHSTSSKRHRRITLQSRQAIDTGVATRVKSQCVKKKSKIRKVLKCSIILAEPMACRPFLITSNIPKHRPGHNNPGHSTPPHTSPTPSPKAPAWPSHSPPNQPPAKNPPSSTAPQTPLVRMTNSAHPPQPWNMN